jgi:hypothetical protein
MVKGTSGMSTASTTPARACVRVCGVCVCVCGVFVVCVVFVVCCVLFWRARREAGGKSGFRVVDVAREGGSQRGGHGTAHRAP